jgi:large subunit ribosomal protein L15
MMHSFDLHAPKGANKKKRILGRGQGSGRGTTSGKGNKGQQSRSGGKTYVGFEGGQMPLYRRLAHRGFSNYPFKKEWDAVNLVRIDAVFKEGEIVDAASLALKGVTKGKCPVKILANGDVTKKLDFNVEAISEAAKAKIEKAGGTVTLIKEKEKAVEVKKEKKNAGKRKHTTEQQKAEPAAGK